MKRIFAMLSLVLIPVEAMAQPGGSTPPIPTTSFSRDLLSGTTPEYIKGLIGIGLTNNIFVVDATNGLDSNAGTVFAPFKTLNKAVYTATNGDVILLRPGWYSETNFMPMAPNTAIVGAGPSLTYFTTVRNLSYTNSNYTNSGGPPLRFNTNCYLANLTTLCTNMGFYSASFGGHSSATNPAAKTWYTNALVENVVGIGNSDVFFNRNTNVCSTVIASCVFTSKWDAIAFQEGTQTVTVFDSLIVATDGSDVGAGPKPDCHAVNSEAASAGGYHNFTAWNSVLIASGGQGRVIYSTCNSGSPPMTNSLNNCLWFCGSTNGLYFHQYDGSANEVFNFNGSTPAPARTNFVEEIENHAFQLVTNTAAISVVREQYLRSNQGRGRSQQALGWLRGAYGYTLQDGFSK